jgi:hypothetical protein
MIPEYNGGDTATADVGCNNSRDHRRQKKTKRRSGQRNVYYRSQMIDDLFETHQFYGRIMDLQRRMDSETGVAPPPANLYGKAFINQQNTGYDHQFTDVTLRVHYRVASDATTVDQQQQQQQQHQRDEWHHVDIKTHRHMLAKCSEYFARLFLFGAGTGHDGSDVNLYLNEQMPAADAATDQGDETAEKTSCALIRQFFSLFYEPVLDDSQFSIARVESVVSEVLTLHSLASQFLFVPLEKYCALKLYERMDMAVFTAVFNYCVMPTPNLLAASRQTYHVVDSRAELFRRLLSWFVCCADIQDYHLPYLNMLVEMANGATSLSNSMECEVQPPQQQQLQRATALLKDKNRKRKRLSTSNDKKIEMFDYMSTLIDQFDAYDCHSCRIEERGDTATEIRSFHRICAQCIGENKQIHITRMSQQLAARRSTRTWYFYLDLTLPANHFKPSTLYARIVDQPQLGSIAATAAAAAEQPQPKISLSVETQVTLLSRLYENRPAVNELPVVSDLEKFTALNSFSLHDESHCYTGECDVCHSHNRRIYVVRYDVICKYVNK